MLSYRVLGTSTPALIKAQLVCRFSDVDLHIPEFIILKAYVNFNDRLNEYNIHPIGMRMRIVLLVCE